MSSSRIESIDYAHDIRPYLQLPHLLSLTWLAYPILSLLFVVFRLQLSSTSAQDAVANAKEDLLASCKAAEHAATSTASMPRYLAIATNQQITDAVNGTMNAARATMVLALTIMEAIINFIIDTYRSTFLCFLELIIRGVLSIVLSIVGAANTFIHDTSGPIVDALEAAVNVTNDAISTISNVVKDIPGVNFNTPQISTSGLEQLRNLTLPASLTASLQSLNNSIPTVAQLKSSIDDLVDTPFELLKKDINDTFTGLSFDVEALPVPDQNTVTFCDQMDTSVVDDLGRDLVKVVKIGTIVMIILIVLLIAANCALEWYKWRAMKIHFNRIREGLGVDPDVTKVRTADGRLLVGMSDHDLMSIEGTMSHPMIAKLVNRLEFLLKLRKSRKDKLIWFFHYVFHPPALACFLIGFFGLLSVQLQLLAIGPIEHKYEQQTAASVSDFSNLIATSINASMYNDSMAYATAVNSRVDTVQSTINDGLFGWVNGTTTTLNSTINTFYTDIQNVLTAVFNNTPFEEPVQEFIRCFIGTKVDAIETALTFLHNNLQVDIPRVNDTVLVLSSASVNEATQPIAQAAIGDGNGDSTGLVGRVVAVYVKSLQQERIMFGIFAGFWLFVVFMAVVILLWNSYGRRLKDRIRGVRHRRADPDRSVSAFAYGYGSEKYVGDGADSNGALYEVRLSDAQGEPKSSAPRSNFWSTVKGRWPKRSSTQAQDDGELAPPHPLGMRKPEFERSWDNILDSADLSTYATAEEESRSKASKPRKLMALGRKMVGREPPLQVQDTEPASSRSSMTFVPQGQAVQPIHEPWHRRLFGTMRREDTSAPAVDAPYYPEQYANSKELHNEGAEKRVKFALGADELAPHGYKRVVPPPFPESSFARPYTQSRLPAMQQGPSLDSTNVETPHTEGHVHAEDPFADFELSAGSYPTEQRSSRRRSRPTLSISTDLAGLRSGNLPGIEQPSDSVQPPHRASRDDDANASNSRPQRPVVRLPLYYGFDQPPTPEPSSQYLKPPSLLPSRQQTRVDPDTSTPVTRHLTTNHARKSSQAVDPFVTPFDDEYGAQDAAPPRVARYSVRSVQDPFATRRPDSNPFAAIAV